MSCSWYLCNYSLYIVDNFEMSKLYITLLKLSRLKQTFISTKCTHLLVNSICDKHAGANTDLEQEKYYVRYGINVLQPEHL